MIASHLRIALRSLWKKRVFSMVNILGLAVGLSAALIIMTYVREELSYDEFHEHAANIYRVTEEFKDDVRVVHSASNHGPLAEIIDGRVPGILHTVRMFAYPAYASADKVVKYRENRMVFVDSTFFKVFTFKTVAGDLATSLDAPFSAVLSASAAIKYFGTTAVVGRELFYENERAMHTFHVTAVMEDVPQNSHFHFDILFNMASVRTITPHWYSNWHHPPMYVYVRTDGKSSPELLQERIRAVAFQHQPDYVREENRNYYVQPLTDIHLHSDLANEWQANNRAVYINTFAGIAVFLLIIACINFMNLSTAQAAQRAREVGVRKVLGAYRQQLIRQFLAEAFLVCLLSLLLALGLAELLLMTVIGDLLGRQLSLAFLLNGYYSFIIPGLLLVISLMSGMYPSFYLARFNTTLTLKGKTEEAGSAIGLRRGLVVFQFFIASVLIIGTIAVAKQTALLQNKNLGFDKEQLVAIRLSDLYASTNYMTFKDDLLRESSVLSAALSSEIPAGDGFYGFEVNPEGFPRNEISMNTLGVDEDYIPTYKLELLAGRNFSIDVPTDGREAIILNVSAARALGWTPEEAIGKGFELVVHTSTEERRQGHVIGVAKDFHYQTLHHQVEPLVLYINKHPYYSDFLTLRLAPGDAAHNVEMIRKKWRAFHPEKPIEFTFIDTRLQQQYASEMRVGSIFSSFAVLSVAISCLGLFGLSAFSAQRRVREIGIRKVLGADVFQILRLLSIEYFLMIIAAVTLASPIAYYFAGIWLDHFPYRAKLGADIALVTLASALVIGLLTVSVQSVKAALVNPARILRND